MTQPVKRGPGRPRKQPAPVDPAGVTPDSVDVETAASEDPAGEPNGDPRIGAECDPAWSSVGYSDGSTYRCEDGKIVERVI